MKIEGKFILKVAGTLTAISLVVAALLGATNALTEDKIAAINKANTEVALAAVVSSPDCEFPPIEEIPQAAIDAAKTQSGKLTEAYRVVVNGEDAGYAFKIVAGGSQGDIEMIVGVDADLAITGISVVDAAETSGIGTKVIANEATTAGTGALDQFVGKIRRGLARRQDQHRRRFRRDRDHQGHHQGRKRRSGRRGSHGLRKGDEINEF